MDDAQLAHRFALLEAQVKLLSDQLGLACPAFAGAISELRRLTGASLMEAKDIVEGL